MATEAPDSTLFNALVDRLVVLLFAPKATRRPSAAKATQRRPRVVRTFAGPPSMAVFTVIANGRLAISVPLTGICRPGERMVIDEAVWQRVQATLGSHWGVQEVKPGVRYVVTRRVEAVKAAGEGHGRVVRLARYIAGAKRGEVVTYRDGNPLNVTLANLAVVSGAAFIDRTFAAARGA